MVMSLRFKNNFNFSQRVRLDFLTTEIKRSC